MIWEGNFLYYLIVYINPIIFSYLEILLITFLLLLECYKVILLVKLETVNISRVLFKSKINIWKKVECGIITAILFLQMLDINIFSPFFFFILCFELYKEYSFNADNFIVNDIQFKKMETFAKFVFYLMADFYFTVKMLIKSN